MHFSFLICSSNLRYPLHVSNRITILHQEAVIVYTAYGIYRAEYIKIMSNYLYIYIHKTMFYTFSDNVYISNFT
jgi:hypothetical protein